MGKKLKYITGFGVVAMCLVLAYFLQFTNLRYNDVYGSRRIIIIYMLVGYSIFRIIRLILAYQKDKLDEKSSNY